ncbi:hypothetical protein J6590_099397 [Homalodisca vitripennis]|nr:hypothetical protein J6590_099397 [Homalodisca vitripennis]
MKQEVVNSLKNVCGTLKASERSIYNCDEYISPGGFWPGGGFLWFLCITVTSDTKRQDPQLHVSRRLCGQQNNS